MVQSNFGPVLSGHFWSKPFSFETAVRSRPCHCGQSAAHDGRVITPPSTSKNPVSAIRCICVNSLKIPITGRLTPAARRRSPLVGNFLDSLEDAHQVAAQDLVNLLRRVAAVEKFLRDV